jgi:hypothetical protein
MCTNIYRNCGTRMGFYQRLNSKKQATQHGCLPSWLGDGDKGIKIVYGEEKNI